MKKHPNVITHYPLGKSLRAFTSHRERSFQTHASRVQVLHRAFQDIYEMGYKINDVKQLKPKHIQALVDSWKEKGISIGEMKNRMSHLRWIADKIEKQNIIPKTNRELGIEDRVMPGNEVNRAVSRSAEDLLKITNDNVRMSLRAQELFGLRRKESIMLYVKRDYDKERDVLSVDIGTKGGRPRIVPITNEEQRRFLLEAYIFQSERGQKAFIPKDKKYVDQQDVYKGQCYKAGFLNNHGLRHNYAQKRYFELTGWECPRNGGISPKTMSERERAIDFAARQTVSLELGHVRVSITDVYLGR